MKQFFHVHPDMLFSLTSFCEKGTFYVAYVKKI
jgi:hypothetical protein